MKTHLKTVGVLLLILLWAWGVAVTDGALMAFTVCGFFFVATYWFVWSMFKEREERKRRGGRT